MHRHCVHFLLFGEMVPELLKNRKVAVLDREVGVDFGQVVPLADEVCDRVGANGREFIDDMKQQLLLLRGVVGTVFGGEGGEDRPHLACATEKVAEKAKGNRSELAVEVHVGSVVIALFMRLWSPFLSCAVTFTGPGRARL